MSLARITAPDELSGLPEAAVTGDIEKGHAERTLEGTANGRGIVAEIDDAAEHRLQRRQFGGEAQLVEVAFGDLGIDAEAEAAQRAIDLAAVQHDDARALRHETVPHEILWTAGYPGTRVKQLAMTYATCQALPTQQHLFREGELPHEQFDPEYHFGLGYSPDRAQPIDERARSNSPGLSDPHGLSGSLVWNTRRLECFYAGQPWKPELALVTGIIWGWPSRDYLIATKVEHFRDFLEQASRMPSSPPT